jgi:hypothetical protein
MNWHPITREELELIVQKSLISLPGDLREHFQCVAEEPRQVPCRRGGGNLEKLFVIATSNHRLMVFDDVEDEFGVTMQPPAGEVLENWELFPDLESAFRGLLNAP